MPGALRVSQYLCAGEETELWCIEQLADVQKVTWWLNKAGTTVSQILSLETVLLATNRNLTSKLEVKATPNAIYAFGIWVWSRKREACGGWRNYRLRWVQGCAIPNESWNILETSQRRHTPLAIQKLRNWLTRCRYWSSEFPLLCDFQPSHASGSCSLQS